MRLLVTAASRHGATQEIADAIAHRLQDEGLEATARAPDDVTDVTPYDAVIIGSGVYAGHWIDAARSFVDRHAADLGEIPVWLFSSGPVGDPPKPDEDPVDVADVRAATGALGHRLFAGRLHKAGLGFAERAIVLALRAPEGDFRDWDAIGAWAGEIAAALRGDANAGRR
jgi:menaquinone-dependent protoporphyrinogen oxidase